jgi:serine/threonine protein kinase
MHYDKFDEPMPGYRLTKLLGRGGFGEVYRAEAPGGVEVAVKRIFRTLDDEASQRELQALQLLKRLQHPFLLNTHSFWPMEDRLIIVMELAEGSLKDRFKECKNQGLVGIPPEELIGYFRDAAEALDYLHNHDVVHRDVKPENILRLKGHAKVADFGLARLLGDNVQATTAAFSPAYVAPELLQPIPKPSRTSDQYSLAISYAELRTGSLPFTAKNRMDAMAVHVTSNLDLSKLTAPEQAIIRRATALEPDKRYPSATEMVQALHQVLAAPAKFKEPPVPCAGPGPFPWRWVLAALAKFKEPPGSGGSPSTKDPLLPPENRGTLIPGTDQPKQQDITTDEPFTEPPAPPPDSLEVMFEHDDVQFTVYRPKVVRPGEWYPLLAYAHLADRRPDAPKEEPDPIEQVRAQAKQILGARAKEFRDTSADARQAVPREGEITLLPDVPGIEFNPERRVFRWLEDFHREEFRFRASAELDGKVARGRLAAYLGVILLAEVDLAIKVDSTCQQTAKADAPEEEVARPYRRIFASYSHKDAEIVRQYEWFVETLGDKYIRDVHDLRAGEAWDEALLRLIEEANVFQLFWSTNSMHSPFVEREWQFALSLHRPNFVRPTYWEEPFPAVPEKNLPPKELVQLHFHRLVLDVCSQRQGHSSEKGTEVSARPSLSPPPSRHPSSPLPTWKPKWRSSGECGKMGTWGSSELPGPPRRQIPKWILAFIISLLIAVPILIFLWLSRR